MIDSYRCLQYFVRSYSRLYDLGHTVVGIECIQHGILEFFEEQSLEYIQEEGDSFTLFQTPDTRLQIYSGDLFKIPTKVLGKFNAIWDRGSLVAIDKEDRKLYAKLMKEVASESCKYLVSVLHYNQEKFAGPPRNVCKKELFKLFGDTFDIEEVDRLDRANIPMGAEKISLEEFWEVVYYLRYK
ncbi:hypothetical protein QYM36_008960 [Artemia franciscana]|uniref:Thiopurine S-methyltransferase n=1 Tax=Artemia franciscana TaxID=6661 RepID=A0AA88HNZ7_ARTSF|nr:hypothetical protein QYM36_008960 [Artemia franciscana]